MAVGLGLTAVAVVQLESLNENAARERLRDATERAAATVLNRFRLYQFGLRGVRGAVLVGGGAAVTRASFHNYSLTRDLKQEFPGARGFGFVRRVPQKDEAKFLAAARADGVPDFAIRTLTPHDGERYVIQFIEPLEANGQALGLDIASEDNRRIAAETALLSGDPALTAP
ncbi:MAG: CHASE domain-containing protein, partial [Rhodospirillaceae bacterium]|nr:CHASE domain-containing protein [Rhodospirillaceae bacterium]